MKRLLPLCLLAACGGKPAATTTTTVDNGGGATSAGPPYTALFDSGRSWSYEVKFHNSYWDDQDPKADPNGNVNDDSTVAASCRVTGVDEVDGGKVSHIECDGMSDDQVGGEPMSGDWFANDAGLYKGTGVDGELVMAAAPVEKAETGKDNPDDPEQETTYLNIKKQGDDWCWESGSAYGDESWQSLCFGTVGVTGGAFGWAGGSTHEATFTLKGN